MFFLLPVPITPKGCSSQQATIGSLASTCIAKLGPCEA